MSEYSICYGGDHLMFFFFFRTYLPLFNMFVSQIIQYAGIPFRYWSLFYSVCCILFFPHLPGEGRFYQSYLLLLASPPPHPLPTPSSRFQWVLLDINGELHIAVGTLRLCKIGTLMEWAWTRCHIASSGGVEWSWTQTHAREIAR